MINSLGFVLTFPNVRNIKLKRNRFINCYMLKTIPQNIIVTHGIGCIHTPTKVYTITYLENEPDNITLNHTSEWDISIKPENEVINQPLPLKTNN